MKIMKNRLCGWHNVVSSLLIPRFKTQFDPAFFLKNKLQLLKKTQLSKPTPHANGCKIDLIKKK